MSPPGDPHFVRFHTACTCLVILSANGALPIVTERRSGTLPSATDERVRSVIGRDAGLSPTRGELEGLVGGALAALRDVGALCLGPPAWLRELRRHVAAGSEAGSDTRRIARRAGVSREHLSRSFQRHYGTSFVTFRRHQRVAAACRLIRATGWPLAEIACAAGFADQSHMTRSFVDCLGTTPGAFRARHRQVTGVQSRVRPEPVVSSA